jgi:transposase-like protein
LVEKINPPKQYLYLIMSKYAEEFRLMLVRLAESGHPTAELAQEYKVDRSSINKWRQAYTSSTKNP